MDKLLNIINQVLKNSGLGEVAELKPEQHLKDDLGMDSIIIAELVATVDVAYDSDINSNGMVQTISDIQAAITSNND